SPDRLQLTLLLAVATSWVAAKPSLTFGLSIQPPYIGPVPPPPPPTTTTTTTTAAPTTAASFYNGFYGIPYPYQGGNYYYQSGPNIYRYPYGPGNRYGPLDIGIGALSLSQFLL
ncbi:hypothetical protein KR018_002834, partial [Drosophila ironensis]